MERSWLSFLGTSSPIQSPSSKPRAPRWHASGPTAAAPTTIPPPVVNSVFVQHPHTPPDTWAPPKAHLNHKQKRLELDLQSLLDTQGQCLGLDPARATRGIRAPDLHHVRKALYTTIRNLASIKAENITETLPAIDQCETSIARLDEIEKQQARIQAAMSKSLHLEQRERIAQLRDEADHMQKDITEAKQRLAELSSVQARLRFEANDTENRLNATLSSYSSEIERLDAQAADLIGPRRATVVEHKERSVVDSKNELVRQLAALQTHHTAAERDHEALVQGAVVWREVVKSLTVFEDSLANRLGPSQISLDSHSDRDDRPNQEGNLDEMTRTLASLDLMIEQLDSKHHLAETRGWNLLICAIGSELEAARKGREVLEAALESLEAATSPDDHHRSEIRSSHDEHIQDLDFAVRSAEPSSTVTLDHHNDEEEDDGPDPNLLISH